MNLLIFGQILLHDVQRHEEFSVLSQPVTTELLVCYILLRMEQRSKAESIRAHGGVVSRLEHGFIRFRDTFVGLQGMGDGETSKYGDEYIDYLRFKY